MKGFQFTFPPMSLRRVWGRLQAIKTSSSYSGGHNVRQSHILSRGGGTWHPHFQLSTSRPFLICFKFSLCSFGKFLQIPPIEKRGDELARLFEGLGEDYVFCVVGRSGFFDNSPAGSVARCESYSVEAQYLILTLALLKVLNVWNQSLLRLHWAGIFV